MSKSKCERGSGKRALDQVDREIDGAFLQVKIGALIMIVCFVGLAAAVTYGVLAQAWK